MAYLSVQEFFVVNDHVKNERQWGGGAEDGVSWCPNYAANESGTKRMEGTYFIFVPAGGYPGR